MLELTVEAKVNNQEFEFTFNQLKELLSVVNDMVYGEQDMGRKKGSGKKLECLECGYCKTRVFEKLEDLMSFCGRRSIKPNATWVKEIVDLGRLRLMWCEVQTDQHTSHGFSPRNASPRHTADIERIRREDKDRVFISNQNRNPFIPGAIDATVCPFKLI